MNTNYAAQYSVFTMFYHDVTSISAVLSGSKKDHGESTMKHCIQETRHPEVSYRETGKKIAVYDNAI